MAEEKKLGMRTKATEVYELGMELQCADYFPGYALEACRQIEVACTTHIISNYIHHIDQHLFASELFKFDDLVSMLYTAMQSFACPQAFFAYGGPYLKLKLVKDRRQKDTVLMKDRYVYDYRSENYALICAAALGNPDAWLILAYQYKTTDPTYAHFFA